MKLKLYFLHEKRVITLFYLTTKMISSPFVLKTKRENIISRPVESICFEAGDEKQRLTKQHQWRIKAATLILRKQRLCRNQLIQQLNQLGTNSNMIKFVQKKKHLQHQKNLHNNKLQDLNFPFLHHSSFMSLQKDKNEHFLQMLLTSLKNL